MCTASHLLAMSSEPAKRDLTHIKSNQLLVSVSGSYIENETIALCPCYSMIIEYRGFIGVII